MVRVRLESAGGLLSSDPEMGLLMLHEMVMRKQRLPANATEYVRWAHSIDHPLAVLPLQLLSIEDDVPARMPRYRSTGGSLPWPATPDPTSMVPLPELLRSVGDAAPIDVELALTAVDDWMGAEVRRFARGELPVADADIEPPLSDDRPAAPIAASTAFATLLYPWGGLDKETWGSGLARLRAWKSLAGIIGTGWPTSLTELDDRATGAEWIALSTERCDWFDQIVDVWLIAVTDEHVTIIAASDSD